MDEVHCLVCPPGAVLRVLVPRTATDRERIAALCNHVMGVHGGGPVDAWEQARLAYPLAALEWEDEILAEAGS